jgi:hypothetical protein
MVIRLWPTRVKIILLLAAVNRIIIIIIIIIIISLSVILFLGRHYLNIISVHVKFIE